MASKHAMLTWIRISGRSGIFSGGGYESQMLPVSNLLKIRLCSQPNTAIWGPSNASHLRNYRSRF
jgi:hypothetical protein